MKIKRDPDIPADIPSPVKRKRGRPKSSEVRSTDSKAYPQKKYIKARRFVMEYLIDMNGTRAYQRCGYGSGNDATDNVNASKLLNRADVMQLIAEAEAERANRVNITQEMVLKELALLAFANIKDISTWDGESFVLKPFDQLTREQAAIISSISLKRDRFGDLELKFATPSASDKRTALVDLGKHIGMFWEGNRQEDPAEFARKAREAIRQGNASIGGGK